MGAEGGPGRGRACAREAAILGFYGILALAQTFPLLTRLTTALPGRSNTPDTLAMLWYCRWMADALRHGWNPYQVHTVMLPTGCADMIVKRGPCFVHALTVPFQLFLGLVASFNLTALALLTFNLYAGYRLAFELARHRGAAFLAGAALAFHPWIGHEFWHGHLEELSIGPCMLFALFLWRCLHGGDRRDALLCGGALWLSAVTYLGFAQILVVFGALLLCWLLIARRDLLDRACLARLALAGVTFLALLAPLLWTFATHRAATGLSEREAAVFPLSPPSLQSLSLATRIVVDGSLRSLVPPPWGGRELADLSAWVTLSTLALAAVGVWTGGPATRAWVFAGLAAIALAFGPYGVPDRPDAALLPLPGLLLYRVVPFFDRFRFPYRLLLVAVVALTVLSAFGWRALLRRLPQRACLQGILTAAALALLAAEFVAVARADLAPEVNPAPARPRWYDEVLAAEEGDFGVVTVPIVLRKPSAEEEGRESRMSAAAWELYHQVGHGKRILGGRSLALAPPPAYDRLLQANTLLAAIARWQADGKAVAGPIRARDLTALADLGFRYLVVEASFLHQDAATTTLGNLAQVFGPPVAYPQDALFVFRLDRRGPARRVAVGEWLFPRRLDHDRRLADLRAAVERAPDDPTARADLARQLLEGGSLEEATAGFSAAADLAPRDLDPRVAVLRIAALRGRPADALQAADAVLAIDPAHEEARRERAIAAAQLAGDAAEPRAARRLAAALLEAGRPWDALDALQRAAEGGADAATEVAIAEAWDALGLPARALAHRRRALALDPALEVDLSAADLPALARPVAGP